MKSLNFYLLSIMIFWAVSISAMEHSGAPSHDADEPSSTSQIFEEFLSLLDRGMLTEKQCDEIERRLSFKRKRHIENSPDMDTQKGEPAPRKKTRFVSEMLYQSFPENSIDNKEEGKQFIISPLKKSLASKKRRRLAGGARPSKPNFDGISQENSNNSEEGGIIYTIQYGDNFNDNRIPREQRLSLNDLAGMDDFSLLLEIEKYFFRQVKNVQNLIGPTLYVGKTIRPLGIRGKEHFDDIQTQDNRKKEVFEAAWEHNPVMRMSYLVKDVPINLLDIVEIMAGKIFCANIHGASTTFGNRAAKERYQEYLSWKNDNIIGQDEDFTNLWETWKGIKSDHSQYVYRSHN